MPSPLDELATEGRRVCPGCGEPMFARSRIRTTLAKTHGPRCTERARYSRLTPGNKNRHPPAVRVAQVTRFRKRTGKRWRKKPAPPTPCTTCVRLGRAVPNLVGARPTGGVRGPCAECRELPRHKRR